MNYSLGLVLGVLTVSVHDIAIVEVLQAKRSAFELQGCTST